MTFTSVGFDGTVSEGDWSRIFSAAGSVPGNSGVMSGFTAQPGSATRGVVLNGPGTVYAPGVRSDMDIDTALVVDAVTGSSVRRDMIVAQFDWATNNVGLVAIKGTASTLPALTTVPGVKWQEPICSVIVRPNVGIISSADITDQRRMSNGSNAFVPLVVAGSWQQNTPALGVQRVGDMVEISGRLQNLGGNLTVGDAPGFSGAAIIPVGYRPQRQQMVIAVGGVTANTSTHQLVIETNGTAVLYPISGTLPTGASIRVATTTWIGA